MNTDEAPAIELLRKHRPHTVDRPQDATGTRVAGGGAHGLSIHGGAPSASNVKHHPRPASETS